MSIIFYFYFSLSCNILGNDPQSTPPIYAQVQKKRQSHDSSKLNVMSLSLSASPKLGKKMFESMFSKTSSPASDVDDSTNTESTSSKSFTLEASSSDAPTEQPKDDKIVYAELTHDTSMAGSLYVPPKEKTEYAEIRHNYTVLFDYVGEVNINPTVSQF